MQLLTIGQLKQTHFVNPYVMDNDEATLNLQVEFWGAGCYCLDTATGIYRKGRFNPKRMFTIEAARLQDKIVANRIREVRRDKAERLLRRLRQRIFDYEDQGDTKFQKAQQLIKRCKKLCMPRWEVLSRNAANQRLQNYHM